MNHKAIRATHPKVITIIDDSNGVVAFDKDGNKIILNNSLIITESIKIEEEHALTQYLRDRIYDPIPQQMNDLFDAVKTGTPLNQSIWYAKQVAIKEAHPEPTGD